MARNQRHEVRHARFQDIEKFAQAASAVDGLLFQLCHHSHLVPAKQFDQERLWVQRADAPGLQVFWPEMAQIECEDDRSLAVDGAQKVVAVRQTAEECHTPKKCRVHKRQARQGGRRSFRDGDRDALVQTRLIDRLCDSAEGIEPLLTTLPLAEEVLPQSIDRDSHTGR